MANSVDASIGAADTLRGQIKMGDDGQLVAPSEIMSSTYAARALYYKVRQEHIKRIALSAQIEGMIAGNPPYNPAELKKAGLGHIANFNMMDARALYERSALCFWNLLNESEHIVKFELSYPGLKQSDTDLVRFADIMAKHWTKIIKTTWHSYIVQSCTLAAQLVKFGLAALIFPDERDWHWRTIPFAKFFVPDQTQCDMELLTSCCVESMFTVQYLYDIYTQYKNKPKSSSPWDCDALAKLLLVYANSYVKTTQADYIDMAELQKRYQNGDVNLDAMFSDSLRIISMFYQEYTGEVSHYMFHRTYDSGTYIYSAPKQYKLGMREVIHIFTSSPGEETLHSNRGVGHKIFSGQQAIMQNDCAIVDMVKWASTPVLKTNNTGGHELSPIKFTPGIPIDIGTSEFQQNNIGSNIGQLVSANQYLAQKLQYNLANSGDDPSQPDKDKGSISPDQAMMKAFKEFNILKHVVAHFYSQIDPVYEVMVAKMLASKPGYPGYEEAREWKDRCIEEGVPKEVFDYKPPKGFLLPRHLAVSATRVAGDGSTLARIMGLDALAQFMGQFGPKQAKEYMRQYVTAVMGADQARAFVPQDDSPDESAGGASLAALENNSMMTGMGVVFSVDNEQKAHFVTHATLAQHIEEQLLQTQMDAVAADKVYTVLIPHLAEHYAQLLRSPFTKGFADAHKSTMDQITKNAQVNRHAAEQALRKKLQVQQQAEQATQQVMGDAQRADFKTQADVKRADFKVQSQVERAKEASQTRAENMRDKTLSDAQNKRMAVQLEHENNMQKTSNEAAQSSADIKGQLADTVGNTPSPMDFEAQ